MIIMSITANYDTGANPEFWEGGVTALGAACQKHTCAKLERYLFELVFSKLYQILVYIKCKVVQVLSRQRAILKPGYIIKYGAKVRFWV